MLGFQVAKSTAVEYTEYVSVSTGEGERVMEAYISNE